MERALDVESSKPGSGPSHCISPATNLEQAHSPFLGVSVFICKVGEMALAWQLWPGYMQVRPKGHCPSWTPGAPGTDAWGPEGEGASKTWSGVRRLKGASGALPPLANLL